MQKIKVKLSELNDLLKNNSVYIDTPEGICEITDSYRKSGPGKYIIFDDGSEIKCADNHLMCNDNNLYDWKDAIKYNVGDYINNKKIVNISDIDTQEWYDFTVDNNTSSYYHNGIVHHNSGKSLIAYMLYRYCVDNNLPLLINVPSTSLCEQLLSDFKDYVSDDHDVDKYVATLYGGQDKETTKPVIISTWQTCSNMPGEWFKKFKFYIVDEAHGSSAKELSAIIDHLNNCPYRIGMTGTLNGSNIHEIEMHARFGEIFKMVTTRELIDRGLVTDIDIKCVRLLHDKQEIDRFHGFCKNDYQREIDYLLNSAERNDYIINLALGLDTTTLMLFNRIEGHGMKLLDMIQEKSVEYKKKVFYIAGSVKTKQREQIRKQLDGELPDFHIVKFADGRTATFDGEFVTYEQLLAYRGKTLDIESFDPSHIFVQPGSESFVVSDIETVKGCYILLASYGTLAVGVNIRNLHNLIFCHPFKGRILNLQSIGRILRKSNSKNIVYLYDLCDDYRKGKKVNHTYKHATARLEIYEGEEFNYELIEERI